MYLFLSVCVQLRFVLCSPIMLCLITCDQPEAQQETIGQHGNTAFTSLSCCSRCKSNTYAQLMAAAVQLLSPKWSAAGHLCGVLMQCYLCKQITHVCVCCTELALLQEADLHTLLGYLAGQQQRVRAALAAKQRQAAASQKAWSHSQSGLSQTPSVSSKKSASININAAAGIAASQTQQREQRQEIFWT